MIQHIGEVLAVIAVAFVVGSVVGWIAYRWIDRTDFAFDQRDLADAIGRIFGIRTPAPVEEPAAAARTAALVPVAAARERIAPAQLPDLPAERARRPESAPWPEPLPILPGEEPARLEPAVRSEAADDLRRRVQSSTRAIAWREARDERLRPGESAAQMVGAPAAPVEDAITPPSTPEAPRSSGRALADTPPDTASRPRKDAAAPDHDEPWAAPPEVWPVDLRKLPPPDGTTAPLALPAPVRSEITLTITPVATLPLTADDIWSDDDDAALPEEETSAVPSAPPPAEDRPPALEGVGHASDNLRRIKGIGQGFEKRLNQLGIYRYAQIAAWTERQQAWVSAELGFPGRVERDGWPAQAGRLGRAVENRPASEPQVIRDP